MKFEEKVSQIKALLKERDDIDLKLQFILGGGDVTSAAEKPLQIEIQPPTKRKYKKRKTVSCSLCGGAGHTKATCSENTEIDRSLKPKLADAYDQGEPLSEDQFDEAKHEQTMGSTIAYTANKVNGSKDEVVRAFEHELYDDYLEARL